MPIQERRWRQTLLVSVILRHWSFAATVILIAIGVGRIVSTYSVFWQTVDEPAHLAAGMEWLDKGHYTLDLLNPPLARMAAAVGPFLDGRRATPVLREGVWREGDDILEDGGRYERTLALARAGELPFFVLSALVVWLWARSCWGNGAAVLAVAIYTSLPIVLAHAGLATADMAITATLTAYLFALTKWIAAPTALRTAVMGLCAGAAFLSKMSAILFLPVCTLIVVGCFLWSRRSTGLTRAGVLRLARLAAIAVVISFLTIWAGYRFSTDQLGTHAQVMSVLEQRFGENPARTLLAGLRIPAWEFLEGIRELVADNAGGRPNYLLGSVSAQGRVIFFPLSVLVKTPLAVLILTIAGFVAALGAFAMGARKWETPLPALLCLTLLVCVLPSNINIGLRHLLPMFPLLALVATDGARWILERVRRPANSIVVGALLAWLLVSSALAHPDYLPYFNELAGRHPERIIINSDLDWGQDLKRLASTLRAEHISSVAFAYLGSADLSRRGVPASMLAKNHPVTGWVAISLWMRFAYDYSWLDQYAPVMHVGKSFWLYHIPDAP